MLDVNEINTHVFQETVTSVYDVTRSAICSLVLNDKAPAASCPCHCLPICIDMRKCGVWMWQ